MIFEHPDHVSLDLFKNCLKKKGREGRGRAGQVMVNYVILSLRRELCCQAKSKNLFGALKFVFNILSFPSFFCITAKLNACYDVTLCSL
jgi:hypothetical protein